MIDVLAWIVTHETDAIVYMACVVLIGGAVLLYMNREDW